MSARRVGEMADREGVDIRQYTVIYQAIEEVEAALKGMLKPEFEEAQLGSAEVREVFRSSKFGNIAGCIVRSGEIRRNSKARLVRDGVIVAQSLAIESLRRFKDDVTEVRDGYECGIGLGSFNDIREGDTIETFEMREKPRAGHARTAASARSVPYRPGGAADWQPNHVSGIPSHRPAARRRALAEAEALRRAPDRGRTAPPVRRQRRRDRPARPAPAGPARRGAGVGGPGALPAGA